MGADRRLVQVEVARADAELVADVLWRGQPSAVSETPLAGDRVRLEADVRDIGPLERLPAGCVVTERDLPDDRCLDTWRAWAEPVRAGRHLVLHPAWLPPVPSVPGDVVVRVDPGHAFGSGTHPTTQLVLTLLERVLRPGARVLDVGTGSGVLAIAAVLLGASAAVATDIDPAAIVAARANAEANGVAGAVDITDRPLESIGDRFDVVLANIGAAVLRELAPVLAAHVGAAGSLVLSGVLEDQADGVVGCFPGFTELDRLSLDGWAAALLRAPG